MPFSQAVRRVAKVVGKPVYIFGMPVLFHQLLARLVEATMSIPLISLAQVRMLAEGIAEPLPNCDTLPADLAPQTQLTDQQIQRGLPQAGAFDLRDCRCFAGMLR
jgi:NADH dehydrogenase